jgi:hypothetical protein
VIGVLLKTLMRAGKVVILGTLIYVASASLIAALFARHGPSFKRNLYLRANGIETKFE